MTCASETRGPPKHASLRVLACSAALCAGMAGAHPLGNNTVNRQAAIVLHADRVELRYLLDLAEIPALIAQTEADADADGQTSAAEWQAWATDRAGALARQLHLSTGGSRRDLVLGEARWRLEPGEAGLDILRLTFEYTAALEPPAASPLEYRDDYEPARAGWKEVFAQAREGARILRADVPASDRSAGLTRFDGEPPRMVTAAIEYVVAGPAAGEPAGAVVRPRETARAPARAAAEDSSQAIGTLSGVPRKPSAVDSWSQAAEFFRLGAHHIAQGVDHLVFLLGLLLLGSRPSQSLKVVTAFTLAHSLTLGLAASGLVAAPGALVEAGIAGTIVYVGAIGWRRSSAASHGAWLAFAFGLVHGFGFAGGLADLLGGSEARWLWPLAAFNLGIEAMQVGLIAVALPLLNAARRYPWGVPVQRAASATIAGAGLAWLVTRSAAALG